MPRKEIQFIGILANVDSSILKLDLEHNFKIEVKTYNEASGLLSKLEGTESNRIIGKIICLDYPCFSQEERIYLVKKTFGVNYDKFKKSLSNGELPKEIITFDNNYINNYLLPVFGKMRLFKEGNICMPLKYYFYYDNKKLEHLLSYHKGEYIGTKPKYSIENLEIIDLHKFIKDTKLPFKESTLQLAFENFDLSYNIQNEKLSFLALMISLETLVHPSDRGEVTYKISRNMAVLIGENKEDSKKIYKDIQRLYDIRGDIVHTGKTGKPKSAVNLKKEIPVLRDYIRKAIKEFIRIGIKKDDILKELTCSGYGEKIYSQE